MNTCDSCKHFMPLSFHPYRKPFGDCARWKTGYDTYDLALNECQVEGDEGWGMIVGPKFGCVLHEPKE